MEKDVELAIHHAVDLASARGKALAKVTLRGAGSASVVDNVARVVLARLGVTCAEVLLEAGEGRICLASVELV